MEKSRIKIFYADKVLETTDLQIETSVEDDGFKDNYNGWNYPRMKESWKIECYGLVSDISDEMKDVFGKTPMEISTSIIQAPGKMPRKMKKGYKTDPNQKTKWGQKANNYINRRTYHAQHATLEMVNNKLGIVECQLKFDKMKRGCDSVIFNGHSLRNMEFRTK